MHRAGEGGKEGPKTGWQELSADRRLCVHCKDWAGRGRGHSGADSGTLRHRKEAELVLGLEAKKARGLKSL